MFIATQAEGVPVCGGGLWCTRTTAEGVPVCGGGLRCTRTSAEGVPVCTGRPWCTRGMFQSAGELAERERGEP